MSLLSYQSGARLLVARDSVVGVGAGKGRQENGDGRCKQKAHRGGLTLGRRRGRRDGTWPAGRMMNQTGKRAKCHAGASRLQRRVRAQCLARPLRRQTRRGRERLQVEPYPTASATSTCSSEKKARGKVFPAAAPKWAPGITREGQHAEPEAWSCPKNSTPRTLLG